MSESSEIRLARIEEKLDAMDARLSERCNGSLGRIQVLEKSVARFGERLGKLELDREHQRGGKAMIMSLLAGGGVLGGLAVKWFEQLGK